MLLHVLLFSFLFISSEVWRHAEPSENSTARTRHNFRLKNSEKSRHGWLTEELQAPRSLKTKDDGDGLVGRYRSRRDYGESYNKYRCPFFEIKNTHMEGIYMNCSDRNRDDGWHYPNYEMWFDNIDGNRIVVLDLHHNDLMDALIGKTVKAYTNLRILDYSDNKVLRVGDDLWTTIYDIEAVMLHKNQLTDVSSLKDPFSGILRKAKVLSLGDNLFPCDCTISWLWRDYHGFYEILPRNLTGFHVTKLPSDSPLKGLVPDEYPPMVCIEAGSTTPKLFDDIDLSHCRDDFTMDGSWTHWSSWGPCTPSCGTRTKTRQRQCTNPSPANGGKPCQGSSDDIASCPSISCTLDGNWAEWSSWEQCTPTCGDRKKTRQRECTNPPPGQGGRPCEGSGSETKECSYTSCQTANDGNWAKWSYWQPCTPTCGNRTKTRQRECTNPPPGQGGKSCEGPSYEQYSCPNIPCPVDGNWTEWSPWEQCIPSCGNRTKTRQRECTNPPPDNGGWPCKGSRYDIKSCSYTPCHKAAIDGSWAEWSSWQPCTPTCGNRTRTRQRECTNPPPENGGNSCLGSSHQTANCSFSSCFSTSSSTSMNGTWTRWSQWGRCNTRCGNGTKYRVRLCVATGNATCVGQSEQSKPCTIHCSKIESKKDVVRRLGADEETWEDVLYHVIEVEGSLIAFILFVILIIRCKRRYKRKYVSADEFRDDRKISIPKGKLSFKQPEINVAPPSSSSDQQSVVFSDQEEDNNLLNTGYWAEVAQDIVDQNKLPIGSPPPVFSPQLSNEIFVNPNTKQQQGRLINELKISLKQRKRNDGAHQERIDKFNQILEQGRERGKTPEYSEIYSHEDREEHTDVPKCSQIQSNEYRPEYTNLVESHQKGQSISHLPNATSSLYLDPDKINHIYESIDRLQDVIQREIQQGAIYIVPGNGDIPKESFTQIQQVNEEIYQDLVEIVSPADFQMAMTEEEHFNEFINTLQCYQEYFESQNPVLGQQVLFLTQMMRDLNNSEGDQFEANSIHAQIVTEGIAETASHKDDAITTSKEDQVSSKTPTVVDENSSRVSVVVDDVISTQTDMKENKNHDKHVVTPATGNPPSPIPPQDRVYHQGTQMNCEGISSSTQMSPPIDLQTIAARYLLSNIENDSELDETSGESIYCLSYEDYMQRGEPWPSLAHPAARMRSESSSIFCLRSEDYLPLPRRSVSVYSIDSDLVNRMLRNSEIRSNISQSPMAEGFDSGMNKISHPTPVHEDALQTQVSHEIVSEATGIYSASASVSDENGNEGVPHDINFLSSDSAGAADVAVHDTTEETIVYKNVQSHQSIGHEENAATDTYVVGSSTSEPFSVSAETNRVSDIAENDGDYYYYYTDEYNSNNQPTNEQDFNNVYEPLESVLSSSSEVSDPSVSEIDSCDDSEAESHVSYSRVDFSDENSDAMSSGSLPNEDMSAAGDEAVKGNAKDDSPLMHAVEPILKSVKSAMQSKSIVEKDQQRRVRFLSTDKDDESLPPTHPDSFEAHKIQSDKRIPKKTRKPTGVDPSDVIAAQAIVKPKFMDESLVSSELAPPEVNITNKSPDSKLDDNEAQAIEKIESGKQFPKKTKKHTDVNPNDVIVAQAIVKPKSMDEIIVSSELAKPEVNTTIKPSDTKFDDGTLQGIKKTETGTVIPKKTRKPTGVKPNDILSAQAIVNSNVLPTNNNSFDESSLSSELAPAEVNTIKKPNDTKLDDLGAVQNTKQTEDERKIAKEIRKATGVKSNDVIHAQSNDKPNFTPTNVINVDKSLASSELAPSEVNTINKPSDTKFNDLATNIDKTNTGTRMPTEKRGPGGINPNDITAAQSIVKSTPMRKNTNNISETLISSDLAPSEVNTINKPARNVDLVKAQRRVHQNVSTHYANPQNQSNRSVPYKHAPNIDESLVSSDLAPSVVNATNKPTHSKHDHNFTVKTAPKQPSSLHYESLVSSELAPSKVNTTKKPSDAKLDGLATQAVIKKSSSSYYENIVSSELAPLEVSTINKPARNVSVSKEQRRVYQHGSQSQMQNQHSKTRNQPNRPARHRYPQIPARPQNMQRDPAPRRMIPPMHAQEHTAHHPPPRPQYMQRMKNPYRLGAPMPYQQRHQQRHQQRMHGTHPVQAMAYPQIRPPPQYRPIRGFNPNQTFRNAAHGVQTRLLLPRPYMNQRMKMMNPHHQEYLPSTEAGNNTRIDDEKRFDEPTQTNNGFDNLAKDRAEFDQFAQKRRHSDQVAYSSSSSGSDISGSSSDSGDGTTGSSSDTLTETCDSMHTDMLENTRDIKLASGMPPLVQVHNLRKTPNPTLQKFTPSYSSNEHTQNHHVKPRNSTNRLSQPLHTQYQPSSLTSITSNHETRGLESNSLSDSVLEYRGSVNQTSRIGYSKQKNEVAPLSPNWRPYEPNFRDHKARSVRSHSSSPRQSPSLASVTEQDNMSENPTKRQHVIDIGPLMPTRDITTSSANIPTYVNAAVKKRSRTMKGHVGDIINRFNGFPINNTGQPLPSPTPIRKNYDFKYF